MENNKMEKKIKEMKAIKNKQMRRQELDQERI